MLLGPHFGRGRQLGVGRCASAAPASPSEAPIGTPSIMVMMKTANSSVAIMLTSPWSIQRKIGHWRLLDKREQLHFL